MSTLGSAKGANGRSREFPAWDSALGLVTLGFLSATMGLQVSHCDPENGLTDI